MAHEPATAPQDDADRAGPEPTAAPPTVGALETVEFALDGVQYEIDLPAERAAALREAFALYVAHARRTRRRPVRSSGPAASPTERSRGSEAAEQNRAIREWARRQGTPLGGRGRIPSSLVEAYHRDRRQIVHTKFSPLAAAIAQYRWTH